MVTLASIVEKETGLDSERPLVAGVFANRLRLGMPLGADPTIIYALKKAGTWDGDVRRADLADGVALQHLPGGGPAAGADLLARASRACEAAAAPATTPSLYFVSRNDGSHVFAATLAGAQPQRRALAEGVLARPAAAGRGRDRHPLRAGFRGGVEASASELG